MTAPRMTTDLLAVLDVIAAGVAAGVAAGWDERAGR